VFRGQSLEAFIMPRRLLPVAVGLCLLGLSGCADKRSSDAVGPDATVAADIGQPLYGGTIARQPARRRARPTADPVVIQDCRLAIFEKEDVASERDGILLSVHVKEGDIVKPGQLLARLKDDLARDDLAIQQAKVASAKADARASEKTRDEAKVRFDHQIVLKQQNATSTEDYAAAQALYWRYYYEAISKNEAIGLSERERNKAATTLRMYEIRSAIHGMVKAVYKRPGEAIKAAPAYEPLFQIQNLSRLRVEGLVDLQYLLRLRAGSHRVYVEASEAESPVQTLIGHLQEVTGVAVARGPKSDPKNGYVVSASLDGTVRVWDRALRSERAVLRHPAAVRAIACTSPTATWNWCISGAEDGVGRLWDLATLAETPVRELRDGHRGAVACVAFSPDGRFCATGGDDHEVCLWDAASGRLLYRLPAGHRAGITSVQFLPYGRLVSAARDNTVRLWALGEAGARLELTVPRRSGDVTSPGASPDGTRLLVDYGKALRLLSLPEGFIEGVLQNPSGATNFTTFAKFSPDGRLILTAGASDTGLQLWRASTGTARGSELRLLIAAEHSPATCAEFAPDGTFVVTGTRNHQVLVWPVPSGTDSDRRRTATLTFLDGSVESSARQVRIWAELDNPDGRLLPGTTVTMVIEPASERALHAVPQARK
jgi:WD40 repeat protein